MMKLTKKSTALILAGVIGIGVLSTPLIADQKGHCGDRHGGKYSMMSEHGFSGKNPERMLNKMVKKLDLTDEQRDQAFAKLDEYRPQLRESRFAMKDNFKSLHGLDSSAENYQQAADELADQQGDLVAEMIKLKLAMKADFEQLLTEEQKEQFAQMKAKHRHHRNHGHDDEAEQNHNG